MNQGNGARIAVVLGIIVVLALILFGVYRVLKPSTPQNKPAAPASLLDYIDRNTQVRFSIEGPVTANENHNTVRIAVSRDNRILEVLTTYNADVTISQTFANNSAAFEDLMYALNNAGYIKRDPKATTADERGFCPTGERYVYELIEGGQAVSRLWSSSCGGGNFAGQASLIRTLFQAQIPDYYKTTSNVRFSLQ